jgi:hypothetical protein
MIAVLYAVGLMIAFYGAIWIFLLFTERQDNRRSAQAFLAAWEAGAYTTEPRHVWGDGGGHFLRVNFKFNNADRYFEITQEGRLHSAIRWKNNDREKAPYNRYLQRLLAPATEQIATMAKLEGKFDRSDDDPVGMAP